MYKLVQKKVQLKTKEKQTTINIIWSIQNVRIHCKGTFIKVNNLTNKITLRVLCIKSVSRW